MSYYFSILGILTPIIMVSVIDYEMRDMNMFSGIITIGVFFALLITWIASITVWLIAR